MQYNKIKLAVGIFVITFALVFMSALYFLLQEKGFFDKRYTYYIQTPSAQSFSVGMPLKFSGFNIGIVDAIALRDDGIVNVEFSVDQENRKWIAKGISLTIVKPLIGSPFIDVKSLLSKELLEPKSTLSIIQSDDINDMISKMEPVVKKIIKIIDSVETITAYLSSGDSELIKTLKNLEKFSSKLADDDSLITTITGDEESVVQFKNSLNQFNKSMSNFNNISKNLSDISNSLDKDLIEPSSQSINSLNSIMKDVKKKLEAIDGTVNSLGAYDKDLLQIKEQVSMAIVKSNQIIDKVDTILADEESSEVVLP